MPKEISVSNIPEEMREASLGSFPISPGVYSGHTATALLYWHYRQPILEKHTIEEIFGTESPEPPRLEIPPGHRNVSPSGLSSTVWNTFLDTSFNARPKVNKSSEIRTLIQINASSDQRNFDQRIAGGKSRIVGDEPNPSLLRAFAIEQRFPIQNNFFTWLMSEIVHDIKNAENKGFKESWSKELQGLVLMWNAQFPDDPFISTQKRSWFK